MPALSSSLIMRLVRPLGSLVLPPPTCLAISTEFPIHRIDGASTDLKNAVFSPHFRVELMFNKRRSKGVWRHLAQASEDILDSALESNARLRATAFQVCA